MKRLFKKFTAFILVLIMIFMIIPLSTFTASAANVINSAKDPEELIGRGFNAINGKYSNGSMILSNMWLVPDKTYVFIQSIKSTTGASYSSNTIEKMMSKFGSSISKSTGASVPLDILKLDVETKFSFKMSHEKEEIQSFSYFTTFIDRVTNNYKLDTSNGKYVLSDEFLSRLNEIRNAIGTEKEKETIISFFNEFGTHMLTEYQSGGRIQISKTAWSKTKQDNWNTDMTEKFSANVEIGDANASSALEAQQTWDKMVADKSENISCEFTTTGGSGVQFVTLDENNKAISIDTNKIDSWISSVDENAIMIPETTQWIAVWNVIPDKEEYAAVRQILYNYYMEETRGHVNEFFAKYNNYSSDYSFANIVYTNKNGYVSVLDKTDSNTPIDVDYGSVISINLSKKYGENVDVTYSITGLDGSAKEQIVCDKDGTVYIKGKRGLKVGQVFSIDVFVNGMNVQSQKFKIAEEGSATYGLTNGYGTPERPYLIETAEDLRKLSGKTLSENYMLVNNIDLGGYDWKQIRLESTEAVFDGNGYAVYNFICTNMVYDDIGFFGINRGTIKNLQLGIVNNKYINDGTHYSFTVTKSITQGKETDKYLLIGALVGHNAGTVENCKIVNGSVYGQIILTIEGEFDKGAFSGQGNNLLEGYAEVGGLVGFNNAIGKILNCSVESCYVTGKITQQSNTGADGALYFGGIVGKSDGEIKKCISKNNNLLLRTEAYGWKVLGTSISEMRANTNDAAVNIGNIYGSISDCKYYNNEKTVERPCNSQGNNVGLGSFSGTGCEKYSQNSSDLNILTYNRLEYNSNEMKKTHVIGEKLSLSGLTVYASDDEFWKYEECKNYKISGYNSDILGEQTVTVTGHGGFTANFNVKTVDGSSVKSIEAATTKTDYFTNDEFEEGTVIITAKLHDGTDKIVTNGFNILGFNSNNAGICNITVEYHGAECNIPLNIIEIEPVYLEISHLPDNTVYYTGHDFEREGLIVNLVYNNGDKEDVTENIDLTGFDNTANGVSEAQEITIKYGEFETSFNIVMRSNDVENIVISRLPDKTTYYVGDDKYDINVDGLELLVTYSSGDTSVVKYDKNNISVSGGDFKKPGKNELIVGYSGKTTSYIIDIESVEIESVSIYSEPQTKFYAGDTMNIDGLSIKCIYNNGSSKILWYDSSNSNFKIRIDGYSYNEIPTISSTGMKNVTVYYEENGIRVFDTYTIDVLAVGIDEIQIARYPLKTNYKTTDNLSTDGLEIKAIYNNGRSEDVSLENCSYIYDFSSFGPSSVTVWYNGHYTVFSVNVQPPQYIEIISQPNKTEYEVGETVDLSGLVVGAYYQDGTVSEISDYEIDVPVLDKAGVKIVTISYQGRTANISINVNEVDYTDKSHISIGSKQARAGETVTIELAMANVPEMSSMMMTDFVYDNTALELVNGEWAVEGALADWDIDKGAVLVFSQNTDINGVIFKLTFKVKDGAETGFYEIGLITQVKQTVNGNDILIDVGIIDGGIKIIDVILGDINEDGNVNSADVIHLLWYTFLPERYPITQNADFNNDGKISSADVIYLLWHTFLPERYPLN